MKIHKTFGSIWSFMYVKEMQLSIINHVRVDICGWFMDITRNLTHKMGER